MPIVASGQCCIALVTGASRARKELLPGRLNIRGATGSIANISPTYPSLVLAASVTKYVSRGIFANDKIGFEAFYSDLPKPFFIGVLPSQFGSQSLR